MYLKQLDIQGFKSFPDKVRLEFNKGITAVVGPNGSGKSNVSDSVRWVLGEQKAKSLRGDKMEDIIFAGTETRKPVGFAQVSITIDNSDGRMPIEFSEVTVTRRVFRSGESEYRINGSPCRLKDVHELFMDTGVGREGYSIIGQGKIDEILSTKSDDRRRLFEEAAGIVKFKNRRQEAASNLEKERANLERAADIIAELEGQLGPLERQSETARQYLALKEELKAVHIDIFRREAGRIEDDGVRLAEAAGQNAEALDKENTAAAGLRHGMTAKRAEAADCARRRDEISASAAGLSARREGEKGKIKLLEQEIAHIAEDTERMRRENETRSARIRGFENEISISASKSAAMGMSISTERQRLDELEKSFGSISRELSENEESVERYKSIMIENIKRSAEIKGEISKAEAMLAQFNEREESLRAEIAYAESQAEAGLTHALALEKQMAMDGQEAESAAKGLEDTTQKQEELAEATALLKSTLLEREKQLNKKKSRLSVLSDMEKEHEGFYKSVKSILKLKESGDVRFKGIYGAVAELIRVDKRYETAIEAALGASLQNIVTVDEDAAKTAISYLKRNSLGRATFLPVNAVKGRMLGRERDSIAAEQGVSGIAQELIGYEPVFEGIMAQLLGRVIIMENLDDAIAFARKYKYSYKLVTLEGDILNPGGAMTGGSITGKSTNIFGRSREIGELRAEIEELKLSVDKIYKAVSENKAIGEKYYSKITELKIKEQELATRLETAESEAQRSRSQADEAKNKLRLYSIENSQLDEQRNRIVKDLDSRRAELSGIDEESGKLTERLESYKGSLESERADRDRLLSEITDLKISISSREQKLDVINTDVKRYKKEIAELEAEIKDVLTQIERSGDEARDKEAQIDSLKLSLLEIDASERECAAALEEADGERSRLEQEERELENRLNESLETASSLKNEGFRIETRIEKLAEEKQRLYDMMWEEYELTYHAALERPESGIPASALAENERRLKAELKALGHVNVDAIEQYRELKERYAFLTEQKKDILEAEAKLLSIIDELTSLMEEQFREQFELISRNFNETFKEMFGGGKAYLKLSDEDNVLESGIEIIAQPPGKNLQSMLLLSGGERALTAIAILFSILKMKPSPFCILDEIEAALDDANVRRYARYLEKFAGDTQFIVITHRKGTMESADVLYGITMQEKGVSKLVSVSFTQAAEEKYA